MYLYTISHCIYFRTLVHCGSPKFPLQLLNKYLLWVLIFVQFLKCAVTGQLEHLACGWLVALKRAVAAGVVSLGLAKWQSDLLSLAEFIVHFSSIEVINWGGSSSLARCPAANGWECVTVRSKLPWLYAPSPGKSGAGCERIRNEIVSHWIAHCTQLKSVTWLLLCYQLAVTVHSAL